jgi:hypothetical protein
MVIAFIVSILLSIPSPITQHVWDTMTLSPLVPTLGTHHVLSLKTTLTMPHPSEGLHHAFDPNQPPTQAIHITIKATKQPTPNNNSTIQLRQASISITMARTNQNDEAIT